MGGVRGRGDGLKHRGNCQVDTIAVGKNVVIGEAEDVQAATTHVVVTAAICLGVEMAGAVHLDDQAGVQAREVGEVGADGLLAAEMPAIRTKLPEEAPHGAFWSSLFLSQ